MGEGKKQGMSRISQKAARMLAVAVACMAAVSCLACLGRASAESTATPSAIQDGMGEGTGGLLSGWQEIEGGRYYYLPGTGELLTGWQEIEGKRYYLLPETGELLTDWQEIEGERYYLLPETGELLTGWQEIEDEKYYLLPETGELLTGWQEIEDGRYYFRPKTGAMLTGRQKIAGKAYYFDKSGELCISKWVKDGKKTYYCGKNGVLSAGWKKWKGRRYYLSPKNNQMVIGSQKIKGTRYIFDSKGRLADPKGTAAVTVGKEVYCAGPGGRPVSGWQVVGGKLYYASRTGKVKRSTTYQGITLTKTGAAKEDLNALLKMRIIQVLNSITSRQASRSTKLRACWSYVTGGRFHYASKYPSLYSSGWQRRTAYDMLSTHSGNCYSFACAFAALAAEIGYRPYVVCGRVHGSRDGAADGFTRHAWVRISGLNYDPEAQYAGWAAGIYGRGGYPVAHQVQRVVAY